MRLLVRHGDLDDPERVLLGLKFGRDIRIDGESTARRMALHALKLEKDGPVIDVAIIDRPLPTLIYLLLWPPFVLLATYRSHESTVLGLWSGRLFLLILVYGAGLVAISVAAALRIGAGGSKRSFPPPR